MLVATSPPHRYNNCNPGANTVFHAAILSIALAAAPAPEKSLRVYFIGNSVTDTINYRGLTELAKSRGHTQVWGRHMIPGAPLQWIWQHPKDGFQEPPFGHYPNALANFHWDVLSLQPVDRHLEGKDGDLVMAKNFIDLALPKSPDLQVYVYARWPRQGKDDFDTMWLKKYTGGWDGTNETKDYFERLTLELRKTYPKLKIHMVPVGHVMYELNQRMKAGQVPGYKHIKEVFADGIHLNNVGSYVVGCTYFATLYKESPKGLPGEPYKVTDPKLAEVIQETVWKVVSGNELAGVAMPTAKDVSQESGSAFNVTTKKPEDRIEVNVEKDTLVLDVESRSGIGGATITLAKGRWPTTVTLRLHLGGLESFAVSNGRIKLTGSVLSHSGNTKRLYLSEVGKEGEREPGTEIKVFDAEGKPIKGLPDKCGYFEITLPKALLEGEPKSMELGWIDFYRR